MASTTIRSSPFRRSSVGKLNSPFAVAVLADRLQHAALHVEHEDLVAQRVGDINALRGGIHGNSGGPLEVSFAALQAADRPLKLAVGVEDEDLARLRIGDVDVVLGIDGDALRRAAWGLCPCRRARGICTSVAGEIEDVNARRRRDRSR